MKVLWIAVAGAAGAVARYLLGTVIDERAPGAFPWGTFVVNVSGSFVLAFLIGVLAERLVVASNLRTALTIGFLGAYTTYSTFALETVRLAEDGAVATATLNVAATVGAGVVAVMAGLWFGRSL